MSGHPPGLLSQGDTQSPTMDKKFYNIKYQDLHVGIPVIHTHNPSLCWYACDYHHLYCPNMFIFAKYQDYLTFTQYQTVLLDNLWNTHTTSHLGDQVKKKLLHKLQLVHSHTHSAVSSTSPLCCYTYDTCTSYLCWRACKTFTCTVQ